MKSIEVVMSKLTLPHSLTNFEIEKHDSNKPKFNGVDSRNNLPKKRMGHM